MLFDSLQSRRFLIETLRNIDHGRHLKKQKTNSPLKSVFDSPQLSGSFNVQDDWIALLPKKKKLWIALQNTPALLFLHDVTAAILVYKKKLLC